MICPACALLITSGAEHDCASPPRPAPPGSDDSHAELDRAVHHALAARYRIGELLAAEGRTRVYVAHDSELGRRVTLRVFPRPATEPPAAADRFRNEMAAVAALDYAHIVPVCGFGVCARFLWCATRIVQGRTLDTVLRDHGPLDLSRCLRIVEQVASALHYAHQRGMVHGDVRPRTVWLEGEQWALVADFAVARIVHALHQNRSVHGSAATAERGHNQPLRDQLCLAMTVCQCLTGASPVPGGAPGPSPSTNVLVRDLLRTRPDLPPHVTSAIERSLSPDASERFRTVLDFVAALSAASVDTSVLRALPAGRPQAKRQRVLLVNGRRRGRGWMTVAAAALAGLVGVGLAAAWPTPGRAPLAPVVAAPSVPTDQDLRAARATGPPVVIVTRADPPSLATDTRSTLNEPGDSRERGSPSPATPSTRVRAAPGRLFINSTPWGRLFVDGRSLGHTPRTDLVIEPGVHRIRVVRDGFRPFDTVVSVASGEDTRVTDIVLDPVIQ